MATKKKAKKKATKKGKRHAPSRGTGRKNRSIKGKYGLTDYQRRFVEAYIVEPNATKAAITAGYSRKNAKQQGTENLAKPIIRAELDKARAKRTKKAESDGDMVIAELESLGFSRYSEYFTFNDGALTLKDFEKLTDKQQAAIEYLEIQNVGKPEDQVQSIRLKLYGKVKPLELLGKHHGVITDKMEHVIKDRTRIRMTFDDDADAGRKPAKNS